MKRTLIDHIEKIYFSIPCNSGYVCENCKNKKLCETIQYLLHSLKEHYKCNENFYSCSKCDDRENCDIIQKIY